MPAPEAAARRDRARRRRTTALDILGTLGLLDRWRPLGRPVVVGSVALDLVVEPDIDLEIYSPMPSAARGFAALAPCAELPGVRRLRFTNALDLPDQGLYWTTRRTPATPGRSTCGGWPTTTRAPGPPTWPDRCARR
ncbi:hypothetical protein OG422_01110 [Streptomyces sp. NBC_01525]|uniref:hypothetical protein n=1 Tax=Streptomyces sp. NBC_01525 TaxID=2903893 RepID=UPI0038696D68